MILKALVLTLTVSFSQLAFAGNSVGNGGDVVAAAFVQQARATLKRIHFRDKRTSQIIGDVSRAIATTTVRSRPHVFLGDYEVDAVNYPKKRLIVVNESRWSRRNDKTVLVMHEYLWIAGYDDSDYSISQHLAELSKVPVMIPTI